MSAEPNLIPVVVEWHDAHTGSDGWEAREDVVDEGPAVVHTSGFLLTEDLGGKKNHISVVTTWSADDMVHSIFHIPKQMVQRVDMLVRSHELANVTAFSPESRPSGGA